MSETAAVYYGDDGPEEQEDLSSDVPVLDDMDAEYLLGRIRKAEAEYARLEIWYTNMLEKARAKRDGIRSWAERNLRGYFETVPYKKTRTQMSYELPGGKLVMKHQEPKFETADAELVPWLKKNGLTGMVKVEESAKWAELKKTLKLSPDGTSMITEDGEVVPGITVTPREDKFTVTVK